MSRKRPTVGQMGELMSQPHFKRDSDATEAEPSNTPISATPMLVDVDKLVPYDRNPRRSPNHKHQELKAYIRQNGFNQVLAITQRPDTKQPDVYMIGVGGNTRLSIMQALWHETGEARFKQIRCQFEPWVDETRTLVAHIQDNDLRGDLTFIDRAIAVQELRGILEAEAGESLSQRGLRDRLNALGYQIGRTMISWYGYTVDTLYPLIPTVLQAGTGRTTIARIHELQRAFSKAWASMELGEADEAHSLFEQTLQRHDGDVLDLDALRRDLEEELSVSADCDMQRASLEFGGALYGRSDSEAEAPPTSDTTGRVAGNASSSGSTTPPTNETEPAPPTQTTSAATPCGMATKTAAGSTGASDSERPAPPAPTGGSSNNSSPADVAGSQTDSASTSTQARSSGNEAMPYDLKSQVGS